MSTNNTEFAERPDLIRRRVIFGENTVVSDRDFSKCCFDDMYAKKVEFRNCDFSHCVFVRACFYRATFSSCRFVGAYFFDCNFRSATLGSCMFEYAFFRGTLIPYEQIRRNKPEWPNVCQELMRILRVNAASVGNEQEVKKYVKEEMKASRDYYARALAMGQTYYEVKFPTFLNRLGLRWNRLKLLVDWYAWGHGEYPLRLLSLGALSLLAFAAVNALICGVLSGNPKANDIASGMTDSLRICLSLFLGIPPRLADVGSVYYPNGWLTGVLVLWRYVVVGLFVTVIFRRISRR